MSRIKKTPRIELPGSSSHRTPTGTVAVLLTILKERAGVTETCLHAARVLADLEAIEALPALRRAAQSTSNTEMRTALIDAAGRIGRSRRQRRHAAGNPALWRRMEIMLRSWFRLPSLKSSGKERIP
jgi:hypothetical protein